MDVGIELGGLRALGAWLRAGDANVDVLLRDLDVVEHWTRRAEQGEYEPSRSRAASSILFKSLRSLVFCGKLRALA